MNVEPLEAEDSYTPMANVETEEVESNDQKPLNYSEVLRSYPIVMVTLCAFTVNFMFNFFAPITVMRF